MDNCSQHTPFSKIATPSEFSPCKKKCHRQNWPFLDKIMILALHFSRQCEYSLVWTFSLCLFVFSVLGMTNGWICAYFLFDCFVLDSVNWIWFRILQTKQITPACVRVRRMIIEWTRIRYANLFESYDKYQWILYYMQCFLYQNSVVFCICVCVCAWNVIQRYRSFNKWVLCPISTATTTFIQIYYMIFTFTINTIYCPKKRKEEKGQRRAKNIIRINWNEIKIAVQLHSTWIFRLFVQKFFWNSE